MDPQSVLELKVLNREVFVFRGNLGDDMLDQRAAATLTLIDRARRLTDEAKVEAAASGSNTAIRINGQTVFMITPGDVLGIEEVVLPNSQLSSGIPSPRDPTPPKRLLCNGMRIGIEILAGTFQIRDERERLWRRSWPPSR